MTDQPQSERRFFFPLDPLHADVGNQTTPIGLRMRVATASYRQARGRALWEAFDLVRPQLGHHVYSLYDRIERLVPEIPEVVRRREPTDLGLDKLSVSFAAATKTTTLVFETLALLSPGEEFPRSSGVRLIDPFAVLVLGIRANAQLVQQGCIYLQIVTPWESACRVLDLDRLELKWRAGALVEEANPKVDEALLTRIVERAFDGS